MTIRESSVSEYMQRLDSSWLYDIGTIPLAAREILWEPWTTDCVYGGLHHLGFSLLGKEIEGTVDYVVRNPSKDLRPLEKMRTHPLLLTDSQFRTWHFAVFFDMRPFTREESLYSLGTTLFVCFVLLVGTLLFSKDANNLVLLPLERMIDKVNTISDDPLLAMKVADAEFENEEVKKYKSWKTNMKGPDGLSWRERIKLFYSSLCKRNHKEEVMETAILEKTIVKLGSLLALGFGEAGARIVRSNMKDVTNGVNAMLPGVRVDCIIGNARISNFSYATEVLQGKVMTFVNQIAEIVHGVVNEFHGAANKNNGDTFFIIWRTSGLSKQEITRLIDMSVVSFAKILSSVRQSPLLQRYQTHPGLQQRLGSCWRVGLRFGLHYGWAIEGAVGSEFKIDASYLSPNVSIATSLEQATRVYDVSFLASDTVMAMASKQMAAKCRLIDKVNVKGSKLPLELYCLDLDASALEAHEYGQPLVWSVRARFRARQLLEVEKQRKWTEDYHVVGNFEQSHEVIVMRKRYSVEFLQLFNMGYQNYSQGEWQVARRLLTITLNMLGLVDGPSSALLSFMETIYQFEAPAWWRGVHDLRDMRSK